VDLKAAAMHPKSKRFHLSLDYFREIERRAHAYPLPPRGFDPLSTADAQLDRYGLPPRPIREKEPDLFQFWTRLLSQPFEVIATEFPKPEKGQLPRVPLNRVGRGGRRGLYRLESSRNWSGAYIIPERPDKFVYVTGTWQVPALSLPPVLPEGAAASDEYQSSTWIGIDGHQRYPTSSMPQIGTSQCFQIVDGIEKITTYAWWQWWSLDDQFPPDNRNVPPVPIPNIPVALNDEIIAGLTLRSADEVQFFIKNQTTGLFTTFLVVAPGPILPLGSTAEWIMERPTVINDHRLYPLPDYADVVFRDCLAQSAPAIGEPATTCRLDRPRLIRMFEVFPTPHRTSFVSLPRRLSHSSIRVSYRDASAPGSGGLLA
jgi:hypothetical protein